MSRRKATSGSGSSGSNSLGSAFCDEDEADRIYAEDLADAQDNVSLGRASVKSAESSPGNITEVHTNSDQGLSYESESDNSEESSRKGYIDEAITKAVMRSADERLDRQLFNKKKAAMIMIGIATTISLVVGLSIGLSDAEIENRLRQKASAYEFDDHDDYKTDQGVGEMSQKQSILDTPIPLSADTVFPFNIENHLVDSYGAPFDETKEVPFFWQVPSSGAVFQSFFTACFRKILASNKMSAENDSLNIHSMNGHQYVNVDLSTPDGIENAASKGLIESGLADVIVTNHVHYASSRLLTPRHKGRLFTVMRHPVDRAIASYYHVIATKPELANMTLEDFASSKHMDKDWFTRFLVNKRQEELVPEDLNLAKEILRRKCLVGFHDQISVSMEIFVKYFNWDVERSIAEGNALEQCTKKILSNERDRAAVVVNKVGQVEKYSPVYEKIVRVNRYDMELYWYAFDMFEELKLRYLHS